MRRAHFHPGARGRGFALLLVLLVGFVAGVAISILLLRSASADRAAQSQIDSYRLHHTQAGLRQVTEVWAQLFRRIPERDVPGATLGFDLVVPAGPRLEVRFRDVQGSIREETTDLSDEANLALNRAAAELMQSGGGASVGTLGPRRDGVRRRGPGRVSLMTAPVEVLEAVVRGVSPDANPSAFAAAVTQRRAAGKIEPKDVPDLVTQAGLNTQDAEILTNCVTADPSLWYVTATLRSDLTGEMLDRQGGLVLGTIRSAIAAVGVDTRALTDQSSAAPPAAGNAVAAAGLTTGAAVNWTVLTWEKLPLREDSEALGPLPTPGL